MHAASYCKRTHHRRTDTDKDTDTDTPPQTATTLRLVFQHGIAMSKLVTGGCWRSSCLLVTCYWYVWS